MEFRYLRDVVTLELNWDRCMGCGLCAQVCVHGVFGLKGGVAHLLDRDACMECGACATNCPVDAVTVRSGVGCAWAIISGWFRREGTTGCAQ